MEQNRQLAPPWIDQWLIRSWNDDPKEIWITACEIHEYHTHYWRFAINGTVMGQLSWPADPREITTYLANKVSSLTDKRIEVKIYDFETTKRTS